MITRLTSAAVFSGVVVFGSVSDMTDIVCQHTFPLNL